jgi:hypothetical protein
MMQIQLGVKMPFKKVSEYPKYIPIEVEQESYKDIYILLEEIDRQIKWSKDRPMRDDERLAHVEYISGLQSKVLMLIFSKHLKVGKE